MGVDEGGSEANIGRWAASVSVWVRFSQSREFLSRRQDEAREFKGWSYLWINLFRKTYGNSGFSQLVRLFSEAWKAFPYKLRRHLLEAWMILLEADFSVKFVRFFPRSIEGFSQKHGRLLLEAWRLLLEAWKASPRFYSMLWSSIFFGIFLPTRLFWVPHLSTIRWARFIPS